MATQLDGFQRLSGEHIELITDLPLDDSIRELVTVFDLAIPQWCDTFHVPPETARGWKVTAYLMKARERFSQAGYLPASLPPFPHGYQRGNDLWVVEQESQYYRRHLLLHEGTHWFMVRKYGNAGPPWLMEGTADWLATHRWNEGKLTLGIIPQTRDEVPYWGRIGLIRQQINEGVSPSLESILNYDESAHRRVDAYAWSWAAVLFFRNHPNTKSKFEKLLEGPLKPDMTTTRQLLRDVQTRKPLIRTEWSVMMTELDYGFDVQRELLQLGHRLTPLREEQTVRVQANRGWQPSGISVEAGQSIRITATGRFTVAQRPKAWVCEPSGVTLHYHQGVPLGKLMLAIAAPQTELPQVSEVIKTISVGSDSTVVADESGEILFRINETSSGLADNTGELSVVLRTP